MQPWQVSQECCRGRGFGRKGKAFVSFSTIATSCDAVEMVVDGRLDLAETCVLMCATRRH